MPLETVKTGMCICSMGMTPAVFDPPPINRPLVKNMPGCNIMDNKPQEVLKPPVATFGLCRSLAFPDTASATAAALGVLTPMPCRPNITAPWTPGSPMVLFNNKPALSNNSLAFCSYAGVISIQFPGQFMVML